MTSIHQGLFLMRERREESLGTSFNTGQAMAISYMLSIVINSCFKFHKFYRYST